MISPGELARRLRMFIQHRRWRRELADEMRLHRDLRGGNGCVNDARFGNDLRLLDRSQAQWGWTWLDSWLQDIRHGLRLLRRTPLITTLALISLALGIGATTALFTLADAVIFRPLPVSHPEQLVWIARYDRSDFSPRMFHRLQQAPGLFAGVLAVGHAGFSMSGSAAPTPGLVVSGSYFPTLGLHAERGRLIAVSDDFHNCPAIANLSDAYWRSHFLSSPAAIGATVQVRDRSFEIVGVTPPGFEGTTVGQGFDVAIPLCDQALARGNNYGEGWTDTVNLNVFARLLPGEALRQAQARLDAVQPQLAPAIASHDNNAGRPAFRLRVRPAANGPSRLRLLLGPTLIVLLGVAGLVWLLACANLAALMRARTAAQQPEIAMRLALGASRLRLIRQLLTESFLLTFGGVALAWPLARWTCHAAIAFWSMHGSSPVVNLSPDSRILLCLAGLTLATALSIGLWPALRASDAQLSSTARQDRPRSTLGWHVIAGQLALALVLLAAAGLFARSLASLLGPDKGFDTRHVLLVEYPRVSHARKEDLAQLIVARQAAMERIKVLPGVEQIAAARTIPASWIGTLTATVWPKPDGGHDRYAFLNSVSPHYFATLHTPVLRGRVFGTADTDQPVAIVDPALAKILFPGENPIGKTFQAATGPKGRRTVRVVGVVADTSNWQLQKAAPPTMYIPIAGVFWPGSTLFVRTPLSAAALSAEVRHALGASTAFTVQPFTSLLDQGIKPQLMLAWLAVFFGSLAVILAGLGLYGVTAYNALRRRREFGIRVALGATGTTIARQVLREAVAAVTVALLIGGVAAVLLARALQAELGKVLYSIHAGDALAWSCAVAVLCTIALLASIVPARRAARADAMSALREE